MFRLSFQRVMIFWDIQLEFLINFLWNFRFMMVLICLIFSVLSTVDHYAEFANTTLFYMVSGLLTAMHFGGNYDMIKAPIKKDKKFFKSLKIWYNTSMDLKESD